MSIRAYGLQLRRFTLPLAAPVAIGDRILTDRSGLLFCLSAGEKRETAQWFFGEISPLPGVHPEDPATAEHQARQIIESFDSGEIPRDATELLIFLETRFTSDTCMSVRSGVEAACIQAAAHAVRLTPAEFLRADAASAVQINALVPAGSDAAAAVEDLRAFSSIKLKVGRDSIAADAARVRALSARLRPGVYLRLDANRSWSLAEANRFAAEVRNCPIEYIEEPLVDSSQLPEFFRATGLPVAYDESLRGRDAAGIQLFDGLAAFVLKPQTLGGWGGIAPFLKKARSRGVRIIVSSVYESGLGLHMLAQFAAAVNAGEQTGAAAAGLDTCRALAADIIEPAFRPGGFPLSVATHEIGALRLRNELTTTILTRDL